MAKGKGGNARAKPQNGRPKPAGNNTPRVVKSATPSKKVGAKPNPARRVQPVAKPRAPVPVKKTKLVLLDPKPAAGSNARNNQPVKKAAPKPNNNVRRPNSANSRPPSVGRNQPAPVRQQAPVRAPAPKGRGGSSELTLALQTANAIAINRAHPKQAEVVELLRTHEKGWIDDHKFTQVLRNLAF